MNELFDMLGALIRTNAWDRDAACTLADAVRMGPVTGEPAAYELAERREAAQERCAHCPVLAICGAEADLHLEVGVWGGALRYAAADETDPARGHYVAVPLIPAAAPSVHDHAAITARLARKRAAAMKAMEES